ncbi:Ribosomal protein S18 acetylase RimI [Actinoalloteichus cyanogriseus DSM 43889]|uniref:Ribosomal protein S18 acetylase RimI n=2 Tax=Actinoalloteichus cyanogriseus TaxID=2893586 RepID=A0ABT1JPJ5_ACTCY|nr:Ribosomal protein S18 acetylase RimI [Actinoalloteichus caeruleus DSM 43889]
MELLGPARAPASHHPALSALGDLAPVPRPAENPDPSGWRRDGPARGPLVRAARDTLVRMAVADVRPAVTADAREITRIQRVTWQAAYADLLPPEVLATLDTPDAEEAWREALAQPTARVFVATEGEWTVGFCAAGPAPAEAVASADGALPEDSDRVGLVSVLLVEPRWGRRGHAGRLLAAAGEALRGEGAERGVTWLPQSDTASESFYRKAGWEPDGTARTLDAGGRPFREVRLTGPLDIPLVERGGGAGGVPSDADPR